MKASTIALLYTVFASVLVVLLAVTMPPLQNADEEAHAYRADQVSRGVLLGQVLPDGEYGGAVSDGLLTLQQRTDTLRFHPERKATREMSLPLPWGGAVAHGFPNTAVNPPVFYAPAAVADAAARRFGVTLPRGLVAMRLAEGAASVVLGTAAIALGGEAAVWLFTVLLLPMAVAVGAAVTQDGPMLGCTALAVSLYLHLRKPQAGFAGLAFAAMCVLLTLVGMARVPYFAFVLLVAATPVTRWWRVAGAVLMAVCVAAWSARSAAHFPLPVRADGIVSPGLQVLGLVLHPWRVPLIAYRTFAANDWFIAHSFIGQLGWLDVELPGIYRDFAWAGLVLAAFASVRWGYLRGWWLEVLAVAGAVAGVGMIQYMTWTVVGAPVVDGVQGRYFLAPALVLGVVFSRGGGVGLPGARLAALAVMVLPVLSISVTVHEVILRYYF